MINIYQSDHPHYGRVYLFTTPEWFSSDFDSLEQLMDVGFDDPDKEDLIIATENDSMNIHLDPTYSDLLLLVTIEDFDDLNNYPELFI